LPSLAAFAYRDGRVVEYLGQHLCEVAAHVYPLVKRRRASVAFVAVASGLLHDLGKSLELYQRCELSNEDLSCLYTGHEVISALMVLELADPKSIPGEVVEDAAQLLGCSEDEARSTIVKLVARAVLFHHQAMGNPLERLGGLVSMARRVKGPVHAVAMIRGEARSELSSAIECLRSLTRLQLGLDFDWGRLGEVEEVIKRGLASPAAPSNPIIRRLREAFELRLTGDYEYVALSVAKLAAGCTIASDLYVSATRRGTAQRTRRSPLVESLEAFYRYAQQKL